MRTTININDALLAEMREIARRRGRPFREIVEETLRRGLSADEPRGEAVELPRFSVGIKPAYRGMSLNQLYDQIETEERLQVAEE